MSLLLVRAYPFPNPEFSKLFPTQREILAYIQRVAVAHSVPKQTKFSNRHVYLYNLNTEQEFCHKAKLLISGVRGYTNPNLPVLPRLESFEGPIVHTAKWDKEYNLRGLNVAVIGNGCSGSQVIPTMIKEVNSLTQLIRFSKKLRSLFCYLPFVLMLLRWLTFWILNIARGQFYNNHESKRIRQQRFSYSRKYITENAPKRYLPLLTPNYDLGCRRRILDNQYIRSLYNPKMRVAKESIKLIKPKSIITSYREHNTDFIDHIGGISAYKTVAVNGFPNIFYLLGPNSGSGHTSILFSIEWLFGLYLIGRRLLSKFAKKQRLNGVIPYKLL
ncbi:FAD/NAD(P)-binding domain-containing protein [Penicillium chrysogenum]|nr:FAD/NAD(P)-binding domain-containing protein [Penicillium chrysogenum]